MNKNDLMNLDQFTKTLLAIIDYEAIVSEGSAVISVDAEFGMGKTFFLEKFKEFLDKKNKKSFKINSWESDFYNNPLIAILCELIDFSEKDNKYGGLTKQFREVLKIAGNLSLSCVDQLIKKKVDVSLKKAIEDATPKPAKDLLILENFRSHKKILNDLKKVFNDHLKNEQLIILVDELDRTCPAYAVEFLEALKHFFDIKNLIFVLAVNKKQLKASVQCLYGEINFDEYYRKFSSQTISLPYLEENLKNYITRKSEEIFTKFDRKLGFDKNNIHGSTYTVRAVIEHLTINLKISLRLLNDFFKDMVVFLNNEEDIKCNFHTLIFFVIYKIFSLQNSQFGEKFLSPNFSYEDFEKFCKDNNLQDSERLNLVKIYVILGISKDRTMSEEIFKKYEINHTSIDSIFNNFRYDVSLTDIAKKVAIGKNIFQN